MGILFEVLGFLFLGLGSVGIVVPMLPTTPFFMLSVFCFAKSSPKLNKWFQTTRLYKKHLDDFINKKAMTVKAKLATLFSVTILMSICFILLEHLPVARAAIVIVWIFHIIYFSFRIRTISEQTLPL